MRPQKIDDYTLLKGLKAVLSAKGYDGASLNELADSSGLKKASLYHRFPGGKKDITLAVLNFVGEWIDSNIVKVLKDSGQPPEERLKLALVNISELYGDGEKTCILRALSMDGGMELFGDELGSAAEEWVTSFTKLGVDMGMDEMEANKMAIDVLSKIQGSLVVAKLLNDKSVFKSALREIEILYKIE